ncbi:succinate--CoA ligase subunit alpha [Nanoarchaeota archaeon]
MQIINKNTKVIVQGITGEQGSYHTKLMLEYGTKIVAGVTPGKGGKEVHGVKVYNSVKEVLSENEADFSVLFVPAAFVKSAAMEALENNLNIVIITEHVPVFDVLEILDYAKKKDLLVIGGNCPGIITPEESKLGIMPNHIFKKGNVGVVSRSGTLTYEIVNELSKNNIGQSTVIGIGGDSVVGLDFISALKLFEKDPETKAIILIGEIGGDMEEKTAEFIKENIRKPVFVYIAGKTAPKGKQMGHAGAIISGESGTAESKIKAFEKNNVKVAEVLSEIVDLIKREL